MTLEEKAVAAYNTATEETKKALRNIFGEDVLVPFSFDELDENEKAVLKAYARLRRKAKEKFSDWEPDFTNPRQYKYYAWFDYKAGLGFVVDGAGCDGTGTRTGVSARLCFPTSSDAIEFAKENIEDYNIILTK